MDWNDQQRGKSLEIPRSTSSVYLHKNKTPCFLEFQSLVANKQKVEPKVPPERDLLIIITRRPPGMHRFAYLNAQTTSHESPTKSPKPSMSY